MKPSINQVHLPSPSAELIAHSNQLRALIVQEIGKSGGVIDFARYMELCLYAPGLGYYSAGLRKFGHGGDFVTAPELGSIFAQSIAHAIAPLLRAHPDWQIIEVGCGTGALAADLLICLQELQALPKHYCLLERSADLRERQQTTLHTRLPALSARLHWLDQPPSQAWQGILLGNEIIDALPCQRFEVRTNAEQKQAVLLGVQLDDQGKLQYGHHDTLDPALLTIDLKELPLGYRSEFQPQLQAWLAGLVQQQKSGLSLWFDYGYPRADFYHPERYTGTLVCHYQQRVFDDVFWYPGLVDLSASVDFTALAEAGRHCGLDLVSYQTQADFVLQSLGPQLQVQFAAAAPLKQARLSQELRKLTLPGEMGERIQLMAFAKNYSAPLPELFNRLGWRHRL